MPSLITVHSEPIVCQYRAPRCSAANLWRWFATFASVALTLLATFATQGLWRRTNTYLEQPIIRFGDRGFFKFETEVQPIHIHVRYPLGGHLTPILFKDRTQFFWSSYEQMNTNWRDQLLLPIIQSNHIDRDGDWLTDEIQIRFAFRPNNSAGLSFTSVTFALFFDVELERRALLEIKSAPMFGQIQSTKGPANEASLMGQLEFVQSVPLPSYDSLAIDQWIPPIGVLNDSGHNANDSLQNEQPVSLDSLFWDLQRWTLGQNFSLALGRKADYWRHNYPPSSAALFEFTLYARVQQQILHYRTSGWEMLKWAWIQFLAMLVVTRCLFNWLSSFLYQNQIFGTTLSSEQGSNKNKFC